MDNSYTHFSQDSYELPSDFKASILNTVMNSNVTEALKADWDWLWGKFQASDSAAEQQVIYYALGLIQDEATFLK